MVLVSYRFLEPLQVIIDTYSGGKLANFAGLGRERVSFPVPSPPELFLSLHSLRLCRTAGPSPDSHRDHWHFSTSLTYMGACVWFWVYFPNHPG